MKFRGSMVNLTIVIEPEQREAADELAKRWRVSVGHIVREALREFLSSNMQKSSMQDSSEDEKAVA